MAGAHGWVHDWEITICPMGACKVKSFKMSFGAWNISWPGYVFKSTTIRMPVSFELVLEEGSSKADCYIGQKMRGETSGTDGHKYETWIDDGPYDTGGFWWNGSRWGGGDGSWSWFGLDTAKFRDEPGFNSVALSEYPLYWGGVGKHGKYEFVTYVMDRESKTVIRELKWGIRIDVPSPEKGAHYFYF